MPEQQNILEDLSVAAPTKDSLRAASHVTFGLGTAVFTINASLVSEIIQPLAVTPLPNCPPSIEGVAVLRGELIALLNIRSLVDLPQASATQRSKWIVLSSLAGSTQFAFPVDRMVEIASAENVDGQDTKSARPKPDFPALDINSIVSSIESAFH